jgi:alkylation response protein AidB-like acyl-CoA dehydrogenase
VPAGAVAAAVIALDGDELVLCRPLSPPLPVPNQACAPVAWWDFDALDERTVLAAGDDAAAIYATAVAEWKVLTAAALVGLTEAALTLGVEFAKSRHTMGVPIGALQGVAFPLTDVEIMTSGARNLIRRAAWYLTHEPGARPHLPASAFAYAAATATQGTAAAAHAQGGLGFTVEADASLYFLRAKGWSVMGGDPQSDFEAVGGMLARDASISLAGPSRAPKE